MVNTVILGSINKHWCVLCVTKAMSSKDDHMSNCLLGMQLLSWNKWIDLALSGD